MYNYKKLIDEIKRQNTDTVEMEKEKVSNLLECNDFREGFFRDSETLSRKLMDEGYYTACYYPYDMPSLKFIVFKKGKFEKHDKSTLPPKEDIKGYLHIGRPDVLSSLKEDSFHMVALNKENSDLCKKAMIQDQDYIPHAQELYIALKTKKKGGKLSDDELMAIIKQLIKENSTHTSNEQVESLVKFISDDKNEFWNELKDGKAELVSKLDSSSKDGKSMKSICSKICRYFEEWEFDQANYCIFDAVVSKALPYYLSQYGIENVKYRYENCSYDEYDRAFSSLLEKVNKDNKCKLTKHELDNLIWYSYKDDNVGLSFVREMGRIVNKKEP